ncbi:hypothetical protein FHS81_001833 [Pseudochelatococcus contaminans]|uniref:Uncharacterized protein n=1 Tax=Pseudochelatococcus contaminans TaxID=1538103 RepID=A0A7W5Z4J8_9HYPH|nr:hypothetical protein [Pseudochelatococcus contaminans]
MFWPQLVAAHATHQLFIAYEFDKYQFKFNENNINFMTYVCYVGYVDKFFWFLFATDF